MLAVRHNLVEPLHDGSAELPAVFPDSGIRIVIDRFGNFLARLCIFEGLAFRELNFAHIPGEAFLVSVSLSHFEYSFVDKN